MDAHDWTCTHRTLESAPTSGKVIAMEAKRSLLTLRPSRIAPFDAALSMGWFGQANLDDCVIRQWHSNWPKRSENAPVVSACRRPPPLFVPPKPWHRPELRSASNQSQASHRTQSLSPAHRFCYERLFHTPQIIMAFDRFQHVPVQHVAYPNRLRKTHSGGAGQTHSGRRRHASRRRALCKRNRAE